MTPPTANGSDAAPPAEEWACVEIFGHRKHYGRISEIERYGAKFCRIEVPLAEPGTFATFEYGGAAIFSRTIMTEEAARAWAAHERPYTRDPLALMPPAPYSADEDDDTERPF